jgi:hypothetical protein
MNMFRKLLALSFAALFSVSTAYAGTTQVAQYGVQYVAQFNLYNADGTLDVDEADGGTEVSVRCQGGTNATATNDFVDKGSDYEITLTAAEMQCATVIVTVAATTTEVFSINTVNNSSAALPQLNANVTQVSGDATAADTLELAFDGTADGARLFGIERNGTAQAATSTTVTLDTGAAFGDNTLTGATLWACGSTQGYCQSLSVASNVGSTDVVTLDGTWPVTPSGTVTFYLWLTAPGSGGGGSLTAADVWSYSTRQLTAFDEDVTTMDLNATTVGGLTNSVSLTATAIDNIWDELTSGHATSGSYGVAVTDILTDTSTTLDDFIDTEIATIVSRIGTPADLAGGGATLAGNAVDIESQTDDIGAAGAGLTAADDAVMTRLGAPVGASISADVAAVPTAVRNVVVEDQGSLSLGCVLAIINAYAAGDVSTTTGTSTYEDPSGTETRIVGTVASDGNRTVTITCPSY